MYNQTLRRSVKEEINLIVIILLLLIGIFSYRVIKVLGNNKERGGFAYVQLLNFDMPIIKSSIYDEGAYVENKQTISKVCFEALGLSNINSVEIVKNEVPLYKQGTDSGVLLDKKIDSFNIDENSIVRMETVDTPLSAAYDPSLKKELNPSNVEVLIYHTHTTENYAETSGDTNIENYSVVGVGNSISEELENNYGIAVVHDKTNHCVSYNNSYERSNETVNMYLKKYGDFKIIVDLHRDSVDDKAAMTANINGEDVAKLMFVTTRNSKRFEKNQALAEEFFNKANELFPGLTRKIYTYNRGMNAFNHSLSDGSILIECGSNINTSEEAKRSGKYIARIIAEHINRK